MVVESTRDTEEGVYFLKAVRLTCNLHGRQKQCFYSTDQLCEIFLNDLFDLDVVYFVMTAQLLGNSAFTHRWRSSQAYSDWLWQ